MLKRNLFLFSLCLSLTACNQNDKASNHSDTTDNRADSQVTAEDQSETEADRTITTLIRQEIISNDDLSVKARNIQIITVNGVVTLRGTLENDRERADIVAIAKKINGVKNVTDDLKVSTNNK